jgi:hypothetical protein
MSHSFQDYRRVFDGAIARYETQPFFAKLIQQRGRPAFPSAPRQVALFGIRREGPVTKFRENTADDTLSLVRLDESGVPQVFEYIGATESGLFDKVINPEGDFKMLPGFYFFGHGLHHGKDKCLVQACPILGERALKGQDYDETDEKTWQIVDGSLHIHAGINNPQNVGMWSAGCQVIAGGWAGKAWSEYYKACEGATNLPIPFVLVNETDVAGFLA